MASEKASETNATTIQPDEHASHTEDDLSKWLADRIPPQLKQSQFDSNKSFIPEGWLDKFITLESVIKELDDKDGRLKPEDLKLEEGSDKEKLVEFILGPAKKVFAVTILLGFSSENLKAAMMTFMNSSFNDDMLPTTEERLREIHKDASGGLPRHWNGAAFLNFRERQFFFLVPVFSQKNFRIIVKHNYILPFTKKELFTKGGSFGQVSCVEIHPAHRKDLDLKNTKEPIKFAIKEFKIPPDDDKNRDERLERLYVWRSEVDTLDEISGLKHDHLIQRIAAIQREEDRFLMFLWADGGNLLDFWKSNKQPTVTIDYVKAIIRQLLGIADAIRHLHEYQQDYNEQHHTDENPNYHYRHGDIKPENILRFLDGDELGIGRLVISDMGSAKAHFYATGLRPQSTNKRAATVRYQAPEFLTNKRQSTSRLCDIWSLGCVTLEMIVWFLYGFDELISFNERIKDDLDLDCQWFTIRDEQQEDGTQRQVAYLHDAVSTCLAQLAKHPQCAENTALGDLLHVVRTRLLVIRLPDRTPSSVVSEDSGAPDLAPSRTTAYPSGPTRCRTDAVGLVNRLHDILYGDNKNNDDYWQSSRRGEARHPAVVVPKITLGIASSKLAPPKVDLRSGRIATRSKDPSSYASGSLAVGQVEIQLQDLSHTWSYPVDNTFAEQFISERKISTAPPNPESSTRLCGRCAEMDILKPRFRIEDSWAELDKSRATCDFCRMRWEVSKNLNRMDYASVSFKMVDSTLRMNDNNSPSFSICRDKELETAEPIQIGFPQLPVSGSTQYFALLHQWLEKCDKTHQRFKCSLPDNIFVPKRLIDVGSIESSTVQLYETKKTDRLPYFALSHRWGSKSPFFQTFRRNVEDFKHKINISDLPMTFKDAVLTTRKLHQRYLWIDSICIIQNDGNDKGDFDEQSEQMESIFSSAYCVLAASAAEGQHDGFLNNIKGAHRSFVKYNNQNNGSLYVCDFIDDFNNHVLDGTLNKRGWVMQERVLARRTIYFTDKQTYWQCGEGVRCETLSKMENKLESFFGDPNFPEKITSNMSNRGTRIKFYEDLYQDYSRLAFTRWEDRPIAISGLERRLILDLKTQGGFGVFDDQQSFLPRSLLWRRGKDETSLKRIEFPLNRHITIPTWSWMAYQGGIDFLELPLGGVYWHLGEIRSPWIANPTRIYQTTNQTENIELTALARSFEKRDATAENFKIIYDIPTKEELTLMCVVMGQRQENVNHGDARHYVLYITPKLGLNDIYERVGVGFMPGRCIDLGTSTQAKTVKIH